MGDVVQKGRFLGVTDEERNASNARIFARILGRREAQTPEKFKERLRALEPNLTRAAVFLGTEYATLLRWCKKGPPGIAWRTLQLWEESIAREATK